MTDFVKQLSKLINNHDDRLEWDPYFISIALLISSRSSCKRLHVGCIIVRDNRILSAGYNGFGISLPHESIVINQHEQAIIHSEINAISFGARNGIRLDKSICYVTHYPCLWCFKSLLSAGIRKVVYYEDYKNDPIVERLALQAGISICKFSPVHKRESSPLVINP